MPRDGGRVEAAEKYSRWSTIYDFSSKHLEQSPAASPKASLKARQIERLGEVAPQSRPPNAAPKI
jgi:hypothetical protein